MKGIEIHNLRNTQRLREGIRGSLITQLVELDERIEKGRSRLRELENNILEDIK